MIRFLIQVQVAGPKKLKNKSSSLSQKEAMMSLSDGMGPYRTSTTLDLIHRRPMEVKYLFRTAIERAKFLNVTVPHLETIVVQIESLQRFHGLY